MNMSRILRKPFEQFTRDDVMELVRKIEDSGYSPHTRHDYRVAIRKFFKWLKGGDELPEEVRWLKTSVKSSDEKLPEELIKPAEVRQLIEAVDHPRDKAFIAALYDSGCRIGEIGTLHIKHVEFDNYGARLIVNGKTGMRRIRLVLSSPYLASWLAAHPRREDPDAPLWVSLFEKHNYNMLRYSALRKIMSEAVRRAGLKKRIYPHLFRHSRATELAGKLTEAQLKEFFGWTQSSTQAATYVHLSGRNVDAALLRIYGLKKQDENKEEEHTLQPKTCPRCEKQNAATSKFCNRCGAALDTPAAMKAEAERESWDQKMAEFVRDPQVQALWVKKHGRTRY